MIKKFLHTSDWHIGRRLKGYERYNEFRSFFAWLKDLIESENIEALLVAGDIFDNTTPSVQAQEIYYSFLAELESKCRHTVIISGNHDSPAFLDAPAKLLNLNNIHVIGNVCENPKDEIITLYDENKNPEMIVCAVPYLRDKDVRTLSSTDNPENIEDDLINGINSHYEKVFEHAKILSENNKNIPVVAMGHLFARGGSVRYDDGVRKLYYVGNSIEVSADIFSEFLTYTALGHLHSPQKIKRENIRYSGSPISMGFGEAGQNKAVYIVELDGKNIENIREINIPVFQRLERISGNLDEIFSQIKAFNDESIWLEVSYTGKEYITNLSDKINDFAKDFDNVEILSIKNESIIDASDDKKTVSKNIENITPFEMLQMFFEKNNIAEEKQRIFTRMYEEILAQVEI